MKTFLSTAFSACTKGLLLLLLAAMLSCNNHKTPDVRDRNNALDGDDTQQPKQNQDSVNRVLNENHGRALDTLPDGLRE